MKPFSELGVGVPYCGNILAEGLRPELTEQEKQAVAVTFNVAAIQIGAFENRIHVH